MVRVAFTDTTINVYVCTRDRLGGGGREAGEQASIICRPCVAHKYNCVYACVGGRGVGDPTRRTSGYVFPGVLWLLPLLASECVSVCFSILQVQCVRFVMFLFAFHICLFVSFVFSIAALSPE